MRSARERLRLVPPPTSGGRGGEDLRDWEDEPLDDALRCPGDGGTAPPAAPRLSADAATELAALYKAYAPQVSRWAARLLGPGGDVEDAVQDVFLVVQRRLGEFRHDAKLSTWLYEITIRVAQARRRRAKLRRRLFRFWDPRGDERAVEDGARSPEDQTAHRQATRSLYVLLEELDEKHRTAIILFELEGLSGKEIAALTGTSVANVWMRISRAREQLVAGMTKRSRKEGRA